MLWKWKGHLEVFLHASKSNSLWMRSDDSYNYSELCSNSVAWQHSFLGPIVYSWESAPTPTGISRCRVPGGGDLATNSTIRVGLFMATLALIFKDRSHSDLWKIELSLSCASSLTPNLFSMLTPPHSSDLKEGKQTNKQYKSGLLGVCPLVRSWWG